MNAKLAKVYYSPQGYWKGIAAIKKLAQAAKVSEDATKKWLIKQAIWQIYLPAPKRIPRPKFDVSTPNDVHQADLLFYHTTPWVAFQKIYKHGPLKWPRLLQDDPGREFMGAVTKELGKTKLLFCAGALKFTGTRPLLKDSTAPWLNACSGISMPSKCTCPRDSGPLLGSKDCPKLSLL